MCFWPLLTVAIVRAQAAVVRELGVVQGKLAIAARLSRRRNWARDRQP